MIITTLAIMIAAAGYLNYAGKKELEASTDKGNQIYQAGSLDISDEDLLAENQLAENQLAGDKNGQNGQNVADGTMLGQTGNENGLTDNQVSGDNLQPQAEGSLLQAEAGESRLTEAEIRVQILILRELSLPRLTAGTRRRVDLKIPGSRAHKRNHGVRLHSRSADEPRADPCEEQRDAQQHHQQRQYRRIGKAGSNSEYDSDDGDCGEGKCDGDASSGERFC